MENIRLPEDFTDRVMQKIEVRERAAARRARAIALAGGILGGIFLIAAAVIVFRHYGIGLDFLTVEARSVDIHGYVTGFFSRISAVMHQALSVQAGPMVSISLAVFLLALAGLWHDRRRSRHDVSASAK